MLILVRQDVKCGGVCSSQCGEWSAAALVVSAADHDSNHMSQRSIEREEKEREREIVL